MSYHSLGDTTAWHRTYAVPKEVYLWRAVLDGAKLTSPQDGLLLIKAVARGQALDLDTKALVVGETPYGAQQVDVVMTSDTTMPYAFPQLAVGLAKKAESDRDLRTRFPNLMFVNPAFLQLTGPPDAVDHWAQHVTLWDDNVGPTDALAHLHGMYLGSADAGPRATPWTVDEPKLGDKPKPGGAKSPAASALEILALAAAGFGLFLVGYRLHAAMEQAA